MGCPPSCRDPLTNITVDSKQRSYRDELKDAKCKDHSIDDLKMKEYKEGMDLAKTFYPSGHLEFAEPVITAVLEKGCEAAKTPIDSGGYIVDLCSAKKNFLSYK